MRIVTARGRPEGLRYFCTGSPAAVVYQPAASKGLLRLLFDGPTLTARIVTIIGDRFMRYLVACLLFDVNYCAATTTTSSSNLPGGRSAPDDRSLRASALHRASMNGQTAQIYVRERVESRNIQRGSSGVVLFAVHGAGIRWQRSYLTFHPATGSRMAHLARAGFDASRT